MYRAFEPTIDCDNIPRNIDVDRCHYSANEACRSRQVNRVGVMVDWQATEATLDDIFRSAAACFVIVMVIFTSVMVIVRMTARHVYMKPRRMIAWLIHGGSRVRMRQALPQHEKRNQQQ